MPEPDTPQRERSPAVLAAAIFTPLLPILYALSIGPATWLFHNGYIAGMNPLLRPFYSPLIELRRNSIFGAVIDWYISLWS